MLKHSSNRMPTIVPSINQFYLFNFYKPQDPPYLRVSGYILQMVNYSA